MIDQASLGKMTNREIDKMVAEKLGWTNVELTRLSDDMLTGIPPTEAYLKVIPNFSTDMNEAMKLWQDGWSLMRSDCRDEWLIWNGQWIEAPTAALAIALAYLGNNNG